jgi:RNA polymerase sigma-70 factor (ECF subfamily)
LERLTHRMQDDQGASRVLNPMRGPLSNSALELYQPAAAESPDRLESVVIGLFDRLRSGLLRYVLSFGLSVHDGEEIVQEVFLSLFRHLQLGRPRKNLHGWVFRAAHNLALKQHATNRKLHDTVKFEAGLAERQLDPAPTAEEQLARHQRQERLLAVLRALPEQDQRCLRLRAEGLSYREIAQTLGVSLGTVSATLARSLARLARADER